MHKKFTVNQTFEHYVEGVCYVPSFKSDIWTRHKLNPLTNPFYDSHEKNKQKLRERRKEKQIVCDVQE